MRLLIAALMMAAAIPQAATAAEKKASPLPSHLPLRTEACFGRVYDAKHLADHPRQQVTAFHLAREFAPDSQLEDLPLSEQEARDNDGEYSRINVTAYVRVRGRKGVHSNILNCGSNEQGGITCGVDCDGGGFRLKPAGSSLLLENNGFVVVGGCGASDEEQENRLNVSSETDDKLFRLDARPFSACMAERDAMAPVWAGLGAPLRTRFDATETLCLSRSYDEAHLRSHPNQTVKRIAVLKTRDWKADPDDTVVKLTFRIETKDGNTFEKQTTCLPDKYAYGCTHNVQMDMQRDFFLTRAANDEVMLRDRHGILAKLFDTRLGVDDRLYRLRGEPESACRF